MKGEIAIVVVAFNRPKSLHRLLQSLRKAEYEEKGRIPLIISLDHSENLDCYRVAEDFEWPYGSKEIIQHQEQLGLRRHVLFCGDLSKKYEGVIVLEDDLVVSPGFYHYIVDADRYYQRDSRIAGIALYSYRYNEFAGLPFEAIYDGFDNYFMQVPCSWGQYWSSAQWQKFKAFITSPESNITERDLLPEKVISHWPKETSWKRIFYKFLVEQNLFFIYPREALSTNMGEPGSHTEATSSLFQVPLLCNERQYRFSSLDESFAVYDYSFELFPDKIKKLNPDLKDLDFECDLNGQKSLQKIKSTYLVSIKEARSPIQGFANTLTPSEMNLAFGEEGSFFSLAPTKNYSEEVPIEKMAQKAHAHLHCTHYLLDFYGEKKGSLQVKNSMSFKIGQTLLFPIKKLFAVFKNLKTQKKV